MSLEKSRLGAGDGSADARSFAALDENDAAREVLE